MAKDKKKKTGRKKGKAAGVLDSFKVIGTNTLVADVIAAALVATAAALKDTNKARRFASEAGDQLEKLSKDGAERGGAMWQLALDIGRRALDSAAADRPAKPKRAKAKSPAKRKAPAQRKAPARVAAAKAKAGTTAAKAAVKRTAKPRAKPTAKPKAKRPARKP